MTTLYLAMATCAFIGFLVGSTLALFICGTTARERDWDAYRRGIRDRKTKEEGGPQ